MKSKFDIFTKGRRYISPSGASMVLNCPWAYYAKYKLKVWSPVPLTVLKGRYFDRLCEGKRRWWPRTKLDGLKTIEQRYREYKDQIPKGVGQHPVQFELGYKDYWARGFVDWLPDDPDEPFREFKFATRPWERRKLAYNRMQVITYSIALDNRPGRIEVSNMAEAGVQVFEERDYLPRGKSLIEAWGAVLKDYKKAIRLIEKGEWNTKPNILCGGSNKHGDTWECNYRAICPEITKEARINELTEVF